MLRREFNSKDSQTMLSLTSQIQKQDFKENLLAVFKVFFARVLLKPRFRKQHNKDLEQHLLAPTSMAYV